MTEVHSEKTDSRDVIEGEFRKLGDWLSVAVEKEKEEQVSTPKHELNYWIDNIFKEKKHILRKDLCLSISDANMYLRFTRWTAQ